MKKERKITKKEREKAVSQSSKMEGLSLQRAKKNKAAIQTLKKYGRAFAV